MKEIDFLKQLLYNWPGMKPLATEAHIAKLGLSLNLSNPIDKREAVLCDGADLFRDICVSFIQQFSWFFANPEGCCKSICMAVEMKKQLIHAEAEAWRKLRE